ncbi:phage gp6-like head-tail connector protein [Pseudomonas sp. FW306-1C-G01A]|uniref:Putative head tail connector protein n=2 Tax=root TaxID=1 RepID=A0A6M3M2W5_9ZZZZ|nr:MULTISPECIES: head-tail connector protein [unclassified Pseudomonas]MBU0523497.1 phage gp6-like head-tail connector protein [Gammaproteobacteria bacterium]PMY19735.1 phage gp6-like head-tail connector protein [Pseudomonas sp. GW460-13]MBU0819927.1 phage gp6-like head-tail connector protein [Gammaproteobacteria bacterium]MBU0842050.1 phage gp6-like head-tail connector protein [Gammaproteobacteria bacterium]MBU1842877.1 phage gp6-like head-tail connector protein [Gammaproteobacteria bacterium
MSVINIELAMKHLLAEPEDQDLVQSQLDGAEDAAMAYLQRSFFVDQASLDVARSQVPAARNAARIAYDAALAASALTDDHLLRCEALADATFSFTEALDAATRAARGIVITPSIQSACLLKLGHLFANREEVVTGTIATELPLASKALLMPYRIRMGV